MHLELARSGVDIFVRGLEYTKAKGDKEQGEHSALSMSV